MGSSEWGVQLLGGAQTAATTAPHWKEAVEVVACWMRCPRQVKCLDELLFYHFINIVVMNCRTVCIICNVQQCATQRFFNVNLPYFKNMWTSIVVLIFSYLTSFLFKCFSSPLSVWSLTLIVHIARCRAATQRDSLPKNVISHQEHFLFYFEICFTFWFVPVPPVSVHTLALSVVV